jgi:hypothetical protein
MARLSKQQIKAHQEAERLLQKDRLNDDEREFVLDNWQESQRVPFSLQNHLLSTPQFTRAARAE